MICTAPHLVDQLHYYLAYLEAHNLRGSLEITINNGEPRLVTPEFWFPIGDDPGFDFQPPALTKRQARLIAWLSQLLRGLGEERAEAKVIIGFDIYSRGADPYSIQIRLHRGLNGRQR